MRTDVAWSALQWSSVEHVAIRDDGDDRTADGWTADGAMVAVLDGEPARLSYRLRVDVDGTTRKLEVSETIGGTSLTLRSDGQGHWSDADGVALSELDGCIDVDISTTPLTNTLPIRRLRLAPGETADITAAYVDVPSLVVRPATQRYTRVDESTYRYASGAFTADLTVDADDLVMDYAGLWRRVASSRRSIDGQNRLRLGRRSRA
jgi:hypothetical protein